MGNFHASAADGLIEYGASRAAALILKRDKPRCGDPEPTLIEDTRQGDMPTIYDLKPRFQSALRPLVNALARSGVTANQVTVAAMLLSFATGLTIYWAPTEHELLLAIPVILFIRMALNAIDGMLAREHHMKTALGAVLNELGDVLSDAALYLPLAMVPGISAQWLVLAVVLTVVAEMSGVIAIQIGAQRRYDGPMGKSDRAFVFGLVGLLLGLGMQPQPWVDYVLIAMCLLLVITIINRSHRALGELQ